MVLLCKQKALYVKCCVIPNGIMDSQGDTLYTEDIKKIFTSFNNQDNFEIYHNELPVPEVSLLENYICSADEVIGTKIVPEGSWMAVVRVDNPEVKDKLLANEFRGVSLNNRIADACKANLSGHVRYQDIADAECVIPIFISFVKAGANGYGLHVMDYEAYIKKSKDIVQKNIGVKNMAFDLLGGLKKLVQQAEADTEPIIVKEDPQIEDKEEVVEEVKTTETESTEEAVIKKEDSTAKEEEEEKEEEAEITKEDDDDFEAKVTAIVKKVLAEMEAEKNTEEVVKEEEEEETSDEDTPKITKSKVIQTNEDESKLQNNTNYFEMTGRDPLTGLPKQ